MASHRWHIAEHFATFKKAEHFSLHLASEMKLPLGTAVSDTARRRHCNCSGATFRTTEEVFQADCSTGSIAQTHVERRLVAMLQLVACRAL
ncbi:MAG: hypothetical protein DMG30_01100 [Acidobacteria bacterium]|nr:MAG: hypothetical protein DMG30_01100 [Acidobacteriota bacterium]